MVSYSWTYRYGYDSYGSGKNSCSRRWLFNLGDVVIIFSGLLVAGKQV